MEIKYFVRVKKLHMGKAASVSKVQGYYCTIHLREAVCLYSSVMH